jgi:hypothetical protein
VLAVAALALGWAIPAAAQQLPATGQTSCWDSSGNSIPCAGTGQDGDILAGKALKYKDNGDGTITDQNTKLVWEKQSSDGTVHDVNNIYTWADAFALHVAALNTPPCFAAHCDWRVPNVKELQSIVNYQNSIPAVSAAFNNNCVAGATVLTGSCTAGNHYWSSTTNADSPFLAMSVNFRFGHVFADDKGVFDLPVRAVRGGL